MLKRLIGAGIVLATTAGAAAAIEVSETVTISGTPEEVWNRIGEFCAVADWHDAVETCTQSTEGAETVRSLDLVGGGTLVEVRTDEGSTSYSYRIESGPLPVADYVSTLSATAADAGTELTWTGTFDAAGATDAEAEAAIRGIYRSGLDSIAAGK